MKKVHPIGFTPAPGIILVSPIKKTEKSRRIAVADAVDDPHRGVVIAIGSPKPFESNPEQKYEVDVKVGQVILYSIVGCEKTKLKYNGNLREEFVIVPFSRYLGVINE